MNNLTGILVLTCVVIVLGGPLGATAAEQEPSASEVTGDTTDEAKFHLYYQAGAGLRLGGSLPDSDSKIMFNWKLVGLKWDRRSSTWGVGARAVWDGDANRAGLMGLWRHPLQPGSDAFLQLGAGIYLIGDNTSLPDSPKGYFLELEVAPTKDLIFIISLDTMRYCLEGPYSCGESYPGSEVVEGEQATVLHAGVQMGGFAAIAITIVELFVLANALSKID